MTEAGENRPSAREELVELGPLNLNVNPFRELPPLPGERTRALLAYLLFGLLAALLAILTALLAFQKLTVDGFSQVAGVVISPVVGLLGAATGYYYGRGDR